MEDYYQRAYGPAADELKAYWQLFERARMEFVAEEPSRQRAFKLPKKYTPALLAQAQSHLDIAAKKPAKNPPPRDTSAVCTAPAAGWTTPSSSSSTHAWMQKLEASKGKDADAKAQLMANWKRAAEMKTQFPRYAINWQPVFRQPSPGKKDKSATGLHPDAPLSKRVLRELRAEGLESTRRSSHRNSLRTPHLLLKHSPINLNVNINLNEAARPHLSRLGLRTPQVDVGRSLRAGHLDAVAFSSPQMMRRAATATYRLCLPRVRRRLSIACC